MITIVKRAVWTAEDERHLRDVDPEEMKLVMANCAEQRFESKWGESKKMDLRRIADYPVCMQRNPAYRKYFHCGDGDTMREMREKLLNRFPDLRTSKKK